MLSKTGMDFAKNAPGGGTAMKLTTILKPTQTVTPQLIGTMTILSYSSQELEDYLVELTCENPMAELIRPQEPQPDAEGDFIQQLRWLRQSDRQNCSYYVNENEKSIPAAAPADDALSDFLHEQLMTKSLSKPLSHTLNVLIDCLDDHGFYSGTAGELAALAGTDAAAAELALDTLKSLEPAGVGARDVIECLLLQLRRQSSTDLAQTLLRAYGLHLNAVSRHQLAQRFGVSDTAVDAALRQIHSLSPYPANGFSSGDAVIYVRPDLYIQNLNGALVVTGNETATPGLQINAQYLHMLEREKDPEVQQYLRKKLAQIQQVIRDVGNRQSTMLRCGQVIASRQQAFLLGGQLQKMTLRDVAEELEVHESTVSRTVRDKYIQCTRGILPMSSFFSRSAGQNPTMGRESIKSAIRQLIAAEDPVHPSSDEGLVALLAARHITISRRTVAKYRAELGIFPASGRRRT